MPRHPGSRQNKQQLAARALAGVREVGDAVNQLATQVSLLAGTLIGIETILEVAGILTPELLEKVKPLIQAKLHPPKPAQNEEAEAGQTQEAPIGGSAPAEAPEPASAPLDTPVA